jgi:hypothetical protein
MNITDASTATNVGAASGLRFIVVRESVVGLHNLMHHFGLLVGLLSLYIRTAARLVCTGNMRRSAVSFSV